MPKRTDIQTIMILGAGPIVIGQACEFDYSGTQACLALKQEGYRIVLVNSNPATVMTDIELADATYIEPLVPEVIENIIKLERPNALLPTMGGQTALNLALALEKNGVLAKYNVELIGAQAAAIEKAEDRLLFKEIVTTLGYECPRSLIVTKYKQWQDVLDTIGLPVILRPSFTLGGQGGGVATTVQELQLGIEQALQLSPVHSVLVEESILGWKEYEMEVIRDQDDNCIIVCSIENIDPMGVHTGDSITIAPALTLTDKEYQIMRTASIDILRAVGVETGGSNVQFAINPENGRMVIIEMNPRVSRSSALASKATGFPIARIAALLAIGYRLHEIENSITKTTPASFEPTLDYIVTKIPRFAFEKFPGNPNILGTSMRSVGEVMALGRSFAESFQKALRSLELGWHGLETPNYPEEINLEQKMVYIKEQLKKFTPTRLLWVAEAFRHGLPFTEIKTLTQIDPWFLREIATLIQDEVHLIKHGLPTTQESWAYIKSQGFSDDRIAQLTKQELSLVTKTRKTCIPYPIFQQIDTCSAEFASKTPYLYASYFGANINSIPHPSINPSAKKKVVILGGGPNRIGQGIEFDYSCVQAIKALKANGIEAIMINCNPETISTDYDVADRLYFEPLEPESIENILRFEAQNGEILGIIIQLGGQTPLKLAKYLHEQNWPILGGSYAAIDLCEDRKKFSHFLESIQAKQPKNITISSWAEKDHALSQLSFPLMVRPSYVLGGAYMKIVTDVSKYEDALKDFFMFMPEQDILVDEYLCPATEYDVEVLTDGTHVYVAGILEHVEPAGIHSGDSTCIFPSVRLSKEMEQALLATTYNIVKHLQLKGVVNIQYAIKDNNIYVIEVNPRGSRTLPFLAKALGIPLIEKAVNLMLGKTLAEVGLYEGQATYNPHLYAVKEVIFPFDRFYKTPPFLGPEMRSTGEVMGIDTSWEMAYFKAQLAVGYKIPTKGGIYFDGDPENLQHLELIQYALSLGFKVYVSDRMKQLWQKQAYPFYVLSPDEIIAILSQGVIHLVFDLTNQPQEKAFLFRQIILEKIPLYTTYESACAVFAVVKKLQTDTWHVKSLQMHHSDDDINVDMAKNWR